MEPLRRSQRLIINGYYDPNDLTKRKICYKSPVMNSKKRKHNIRRNEIAEVQGARHNLMTLYNMRNSNNSWLQRHGIVDFKNVPHIVPSRRPVQTKKNSRSYMMKMILILLFIIIPLVFCTWSVREYNSIKQSLIEDKEQYEMVSREITSMKEVLIQESQHCKKMGSDVNIIKQALMQDRQHYEKVGRDISTMRHALEEQKQRFEEVQDMIQRNFSRLQADDIGMPDYALESLGGSVISSTETYINKYCTLFGYSFPCNKNGPQTVIQPEVHPGKCWPFKGSEGQLVISLLFPVRISHVTLQHLPKQLSPSGDIGAAPRDFDVYGIINDTVERHLGAFTYDLEGDPIQTFEVENSSREAFKMVKLKIFSNWGHPNYTCVYRFRIHSQLKDT